MTLGESIYYYRKRAGLSQEALAERVGVSRQAVSRWELDDATPEVGKLMALAKAFGITTDQLLSGEEPAAVEKTYAPPGGKESWTAPSKGQTDWDRLPGFLGRQVRRHGWLAGVYIALQGLGVAIVGGIARYAFNAMFRVSVNDILGPGSGWASAVVDGAGNIINAPALTEGPSNFVSNFYGSQVTVISDMGRIFVNIATVIMVLGILVVIAGLVLAAYFYRKGREN